MHFLYRNLYHVHWTRLLDNTLNSHSTCTAVAITFFRRVIHSFPSLQLTIIIFTTKLMLSLKNYSKNMLNYSFYAFGKASFGKRIWKTAADVYRSNSMAPTYFKITAATEKNVRRQVIFILILVFTSRTNNYLNNYSVVQTVASFKWWNNIEMGPRRILFQYRPL